MPKTLVLKLEGVFKSFARVETDDVTNAVADVNLSMRNGEFISLVGTSGCGKSTILRMIAGLISPTAGRLTINGVPIEGPGPERGFVFQKPALFPWLTVEKNISFGLRMSGHTAENGERLARIIHLVGLEDFKNDYPGQLSGGMAQRAALARSLINQPDILLLDEPLGALDAFTRMNIQDELLSIWQKKKQLMIMVTHDVDEAVYMGTRVLVMEAHPGRIRIELPIEMEYPRNRSSALFVEYRNRILEMLHYGTKER